MVAGMDPKLRAVAEARWIDGRKQEGDAGPPGADEVAGVPPGAAGEGVPGREVGGGMSDYKILLCQQCAGLKANICEAEYDRDAALARVGVLEAALRGLVGGRSLTRTRPTRAR